MTPQVFHDEIAHPNMMSALEHEGDLRVIVNAILTLDALTGVIHANGLASKRPEIMKHDKDDAYREALSHVSNSFRILRDAAAAIKHGDLTGKRKNYLARLLRGPEAMKTVSNVLGHFRCGDSLGADVIVIEYARERDGISTEPSHGYVRASTVVANVYRMLKRIVDGGPAETDGDDLLSPD